MMLNKVHAITYIISDLSFFFGYGELMDYYMAPNPRPQTRTSLKWNILENLEKLDQLRQHYVEPLLNLFNAIHNNRKGECLKVDEAAVQLLTKMEGIQIMCNTVNKMADSCKSVKDKLQLLRVQMSMKVALNILYIMLYNLNKENLRQVVNTIDIEQMLMKLVQASLQIGFIPIRKVVIMFYLVLRSKFGDQSKLDEPSVDRLKQNIITESMLQAETSLTPRLLIKDPNPVEAFYRRHNINECTLAQYIVVGLLRALLTVCSLTKSNSNSPSGVDAFREWRTSFLYATEIYGNSENFPEKLKNLLELFVVNESNIDKKDERTELTNDIDRHRIYTVGAITSFFAFLLVKLQANTFLQYSYLIQLISDANGILVLLKFLTDKFQLTGVTTLSLYDSNQQFFECVKCTIHNVLLLLLATCNNFTEKIKNFLFDYNSFLILKKLPGLFEEDLIITELSCALLKIQIPFFTKKMKEASNNMKMIAQIYCKCPRQPEETHKITPYQRLLLKNKIKPRKSKEVLILEQVKNLHVEFNNYNYWHVEQPAPIIAVDYLARLHAEVQLDPSLKQNYQQWLEENVWQYYD